MKLFNKITAAMFSILTVASMGIVISASATNYDNPTDQYGNSYNPNIRDTPWNAGLSEHDYCRPKFNDSSIYVCNYSMYHSANLNVYGRRSMYGADMNVSINGHQTTNVYLPANRTAEIYQGIFEYNCTYAHIYFNDADSISGAASGVWSPDCDGSYGSLN